MDKSTFQYLSPTENQMQVMAKLREAAKVYSDAIEALVPDGPDKTYIIRKHRDVAMWVNVAVTRHPDGTPRQ